MGLPSNRMPDGQSGGNTQVHPPRPLIAYRVGICVAERLIGFHSRHHVDRCGNDHRFEEEHHKSLNVIRLGFHRAGE